MAVIKKQPSAHPSELQIALENRAFELQLFWQRSNYFLALVTALGVGIFAIKDQFFSLIISLFAVVSSYLWFRTNLGSRFWQENWEVEVNLIAEEQGIRSFQRSEKGIKSQVEASLLNKNRDWFLRQWIDRQIVKKPSVTYHMIILSLISTFVWIVVAVTIMFRLCPNLGSLNQWFFAIFV